MDYCKDHRQGDFEPSSFSNLGFGTQPLGPHFPGNRTHFFLGEPSVSTLSRMAFDQCNQSTVSKYISILKLCYNGRVPVETLAEAMRGTRSPEAARGTQEDKHQEQWWTLQPTAKCSMDFWCLCSDHLKFLPPLPVEVLLISQRPIQNVPTFPEEGRSSQSEWIIPLFLQYFV